MKTNLHLLTLGVFLLALIPCSALAGLLAVAAFATELQDGFSVNDIMAILLLVTAVGLGIAGLRLFFRLRIGFEARMRRKLLAFYLVTAVYCTFWASSPASRDGDHFPIFSLHDQVLIVGVLSIPVFLTLFTPPMRPNEALLPALKE